MPTVRRFRILIRCRRGAFFVSAATWLLFLISSGLALGVALAPGEAAAEPYRPTDEATLVERLPRSNSSEDAAVKDLRAALAADPGNVAAATALARHYVERNRAGGDPRYLGYAEAALAPWRDRSDAPTAVLAIRAVLAQRLHRFAAALRDFDRILARRPDHPQARLSRAFVLQAQGRAREAGDDCRRLPPSVGDLVIATCLARVESLTGGAVGAQARLATALRHGQDQPAGLRRWALTNLAEIAARRGETEAAERAFRAALGLGREDSYLLDAFADFLLDAGRDAEVRALLENESRTDGHLLRLALAGRALGHPDWQAQAAELGTRFEAARRRGGALHLREEARFELALGGGPDRALELALANWQLQREPWDARLVIVAALAAKRPVAAGDVIAWLERSDLDDPALHDLRAALREMGS